MSRVLHGTVVSDAMDKTVVVAINSVKEHPIYRKKYKVTTKFKAHDAENKYSVGQLVEIRETKPYSKDKYFEVVRAVAATEVEN